MDSCGVQSGIRPGRARLTKQDQEPSGGIPCSGQSSVCAWDCPGRGTALWAGQGTDCGLLGGFAPSWASAPAARARARARAQAQGTAVPVEGWGLSEEPGTPCSPHFPPLTTTPSVTRRLRGSVWLCGSVGFCFPSLSLFLAFLQMCLTCHALRTARGRKPLCILRGTLPHTKTQGISMRISWYTCRKDAKSRAHDANAPNPTPTRAPFPQRSTHLTRPQRHDLEEESPLGKAWSTRLQPSGKFTTTDPLPVELCVLAYQHFIC